METQKQEILSDLFAIRAAMSLISVEKDKIDKITAKCNHEKLLVRKEAFEMIYYNNKYSQPAVCYEKPVDDSNCYFFVIDELENDENYNKLIEDFKREQECARKYSKFFRNLFTFNWDIAFDFDLQTYNLKLYKSITKYIENAPQARMKCIDLENKKNAEIMPILNMAESIYNVTTKEYANFIDVRDWKYVDLIIYYLQTGRADNIKEALQQVDRQIQTDSIVGAVENATKKICKSIERLEKAVCSRLDKIIAQNDIRIEQGVVQNVLLAKIHSDTEELAKDIDYIKEYHFKV